MNLLEHYIIEIHSVTDITNKYTERTGKELKEPLLDVDLTYDCYGGVKRDNIRFIKSK